LKLNLWELSILLKEQNFNFKKEKLRAVYRNYLVNQNPRADSTFQQFPKLKVKLTIEKTGLTTSAPTGEHG
jgi:hypothetical protein